MVKITSYFTIFAIIGLLLVQSIEDSFFLFHELDYLLQPYDLRGLAKALIYFLTYFSSILYLLIFVLIKSEKIFKILAVITSLWLSIDLFVQLIGKERGFSSEIFTLVIAESNNYGFLQIYLREISIAVGAFFVFVIIFFYIRKNIDYRIKNFFFILLLLPFFISNFTVRHISSIVYNGYPSFIKIPLIILDYNINKKVITKRILNADILPSKLSAIKNIILIIDESICGSYLSINSYPKKTTPKLEKLLQSNNNIINFGSVNSVSNCSLPSNMYLRLGMDPSLNPDFKFAWINFPTIYQFAKRAGYSTYLFDSQAAKDSLQDALSVYDMEDINHYITFKRTIPQHKRDIISIKKIFKTLHDEPEKKHFIVVVKFGAHFPYLLSYDAQKDTFFTPVQTTTFNALNFKEKDKLINTYLNSIKKNVDVFLDTIYHNINLDDTVVFYTSDHGQDILETKNRILTHCNTSKIKKNEVTVPLLIIGQDVKESFVLKNNKHYSQIQIFPTILELLGYSKEIYEQYGKTLKEGIDKNITRKYYITGTGNIGIYDK